MLASILWADMYDSGGENPKRVNGARGPVIATYKKHACREPREGGIGWNTHLHLALALAPGGNFVTERVEYPPALSTHLH